MLAGVQLELPFPMALGLPGSSWLRWLTIASNLVWLGLLMTLATGFLLRRLRKSLDKQRRGAQLLQAVASQVPGMVFRLQAEPGRVPAFVYASPGARDVLDLPAEVLLSDASALARRLPPEDMQRLWQQLDVAAGTAGTLETEVCVQRSDGRTSWARVQVAAVERHGATTVLNGVMTDITEHKQADARMRRQAYTDALTGLPNRLALQGWLGDAMDQAQRQATGMALLLVDLDRFKEVNDTRGHSGGDELLVQVGQRLQAATGQGAALARAGGDEFVLLLTGADCESRAAALGNRILADLARPFTVRGEKVFVSASAGMALHPDDGTDIDELLTKADQALYESKGNGRNRCSRYTPELHARVQRRLALATGLRHAAERGQLSLVYQPVVDLRTGRVSKAEALLRWQHPELGTVSPAEFVPVAESAGLINGIGAWVLETAARQAGIWRRTLDPSFRVGINFSPLQFRSAQGPSRSWAEQLQALGVPGQALVVEITEGLLLDHSDALACQLRELRATGVQVALDDFGTGYSALSYLHRYEIDLLKIDRSFVSGAAAGRTGRSLCRALLALAQELDLEVIAEGVETDEQRDRLRAMGCHHAQGWLYARAMPVEAFEAWWRLRGDGEEKGIEQLAARPIAAAADDVTGG
jgi:diguanylate cyclase (GGDEF)-like protein